MDSLVEEKGEITAGTVFFLPKASSIGVIQTLKLEELAVCDDLISTD